MFNQHFRKRFTITRDKFNLPHLIVIKIAQVLNLSLFS